MDSPETPVLTVHEQKHTLSAKKNKKKRKEKRGTTSLSSPYDTYWPQCQDEDGNNLNQLLTSTLEPLRRPVSKVKWSELRKLSREERQNTSKNLQQRYPDDNSAELRKSVCFGVNAVTRGLESVSVGCVLLAQDADPDVLISHIPMMCGMQDVPVLLMPTLRSITKASLGFGCLALGIKRSALQSDNSHFQAVYHEVKKLSAKNTVPEPLPSFHNALIHVQSEDEEEEPPEPKVPEVRASRDLYLYRTSTKQRVFMPESAPQPQPSDDFLSLDLASTTKAPVISKPVPMEVDDVEPHKKKRPAPEVHYRPVISTILLPNPAKIRKKELKKKLKKS